MRKRKLGQSGNEVGKRLVPAVHAGRAIEALVQQLVRLRAADAKDQSGGMAQQVLDRDRALLRLACEIGLAGLRVFGLDGDHQVLELGQILVDRGCEIKLVLLDQHHGGHAGDRLAHRSDPEDRIRL